MKWEKLKKPYRAELTHEIDLTCKDKVIVSASKDNPVVGTVTHYSYKKFGRNNVRMCRFYPDIAPDSYYEISSNWLKIIKNN